MKKYLQIIKNTWSEYSTYRLNFVLWRVRLVMQLLVTYFLWWAIFGQRQELFGYTQATILTYVLLSSIVRTVVLGTRTLDVGEVINRGQLSNFLIRPMNFFSYYLARDVTDKMLNIAFASVEIVILVLLLRPPIFFQTDPVFLALSIVAACVGAVLYFYFSMLLGLLGFWTSEVWAPRFLSFVVIEFFAGWFFPLDILPEPLFIAAQSLPFSYFIYFPLKVYLGQIGGATLITGFTVGIMWLFIFWYLTAMIWKKGLRVYTAEGQ